jgi:spermidine synthase
MLPPTIFIGMSLPLMVRGLSRSLEVVGSDSGRIYSWNTCGNVAGALLAGLILLPLLGTERLLTIGSIGTCLLGVLAFIFYKSRSRHLASVISFGTAVVLFLVIFQTAFSGWDPRWFTLVPFRRTGSSRSLPETRAILSRREILLFKDDPAGHLMVEKRHVEGRDKLRLFVNGKVDGSSDEDMITQVLSAHLPLLLHPRPKDMLVIGLATGVTSGSALTHPVERMDVVEIVRAMPQATALFRSVNQSPDSDPRFHLIVDDARSYLSYTRQQYDVIISEPSNPWMAGTGSLFSKDFYGRASKALRPDGIYLQWVQAYELGEETFASAVRSFRSVFPYVYGFQTVYADVLLLGSRQPIRPDWSIVQARFQRPAISRDLDRVRVKNLSALLYLQRFSPGTIDFLGSLTELENTDDNHLLEYRAPRALFLRLSPDVLDEIDERFTASAALFWNQFLASSPDPQSLPQTLQLLLVGDVGIPGLVQANQLALFHLNGSSLTPKPPELFPNSFFIQTPPSETQIADRLNYLIGMHDGARASELLDSYDTAILTEAVLSREKALFWLAQIQDWTHPGMPGMEARLRIFRIHLLTATRQLESAAAELLAWVRESSPPPPRWAILAGSQIDPVKLRPAIIQAYRTRK